jgi:hypothetical protein
MMLYLDLTETNFFLLILSKELCLFKPPYLPNSFMSLIMENLDYLYQVGYKIN